MRNSKKAVLLFEVACVVLLLSIMSFFLFRGYSLFMKAGRRSGEYLELALLSEEKICDFQIKEKNQQAPDEELEGNFAGRPYAWTVSFEDSDYPALKRVFLKVSKEGRKEYLDTVSYFIFEAEQKLF
ncbi:MAG: hypothetical protein ABH858_06420 [Candidatus Omnitrophota bacterium]